MKKRFIALLMATLMVAGTFTGCGNSSTKDTSDTTAAQTQTEAATTAEAKDTVVEIIMPVFTDDDTSTEDYMAELKSDNPQFISVELYKEDYCKVSLNDSDRKKFLDEMGDFSQYLISTLTEDENYKDLFTNATFETSDNGDYILSLYCTSEAYENAGFNGFSAVILSAMLGNVYQGMNMVDISEITGTIKIIDTDTTEVLYDSSAEN